MYDKMDIIKNKIDMINDKKADKTSKYYVLETAKNYLPYELELMTVDGYIIYIHSFENLQHLYLYVMGMCHMLGI